MTQVDRFAAPGVLDAVKCSYATRHSADHRKRGGDFIAHHYDAGRFTLTIGDASSKEADGVEVARILRRSFAAAAPVSSPSEILRAMSSAFIREAGLIAPSPTFAAVLVATFEFERGVLTYAAAGVEGGLVFLGRSAHDHLSSTGPLLGIVEQPEYEERSIGFFPDDILVAYTDGVTEAVAAADARQFGSLGIVRAMRQLRPVGPPTIDAIWQKIDQYTGGTYHDDATLAIVTAVKTPANVMPLRRSPFTNVAPLDWNQIGSTGLIAGSGGIP
jgi:sigma-B regulation protein RsbU (phosphoserine phosphatase)